jgi:hypothetical protein
MSANLYDKNKKTINLTYKFYSYNFDHSLLAKSSLMNTIPSINLNNCASIGKERKRNLSSLNHSNQNQNVSHLDLEPIIQNCSKNMINILTNQNNIKMNEHIDLNDNNYDIEANVELSVVSLNDENSIIDLNSTQTIPNEYSEDVARLFFMTKRFLDNASTNLNSIYEGFDDESRLFGYTLLNKCESTNQHRTLDNINTNDGRIISNDPVTVIVPVNSFTKVESPRQNGKNKKKSLSSLCQPKSDHTQINKEKQTANILNEKSTNCSNNAFMTAIASSSTASSPQKLDQSLTNWIKLIESSLTDQNNNDLTADQTNDTDNLIQEEEPNRKRLKPTDQNVIRLRGILFSLANTFLSDLMIATEKLKKFRQSFIELVKDLTDDKIETFVQLIFDFLNETLFFKLLDSVKVEWSYRLKSYA